MKRKVLPAGLRTRAATMQTRDFGASYCLASRDLSCSREAYCKLLDERASTAGKFSVAIIIFPRLSVVVIATFFGGDKYGG